MIAKILVIFALIGLMSCAPPTKDLLDALTVEKGTKSGEDGINTHPTPHKPSSSLQRRDTHERPLENIKPIDEKLGVSPPASTLHKVPLTKDTKGSGLDHTRVGL